MGLLQHGQIFNEIWDVESALWCSVQKMDYVTLHMGILCPWLSEGSNIMVSIAQHHNIVFKLLRRKKIENSDFDCPSEEKHNRSYENR